MPVLDFLITGCLVELFVGVLPGELTEMDIVEAGLPLNEFRLKSGMRRTYDFPDYANERELPYVLPVC